MLVLKAALYLLFSLLSKLVLFKPKGKKMFWSDGYNDYMYLLQRGNRNLEDSEDSEDSLNLAKKRILPKK